MSDRAAIGPRLFGAFLIVASLISLLAAVTLFWPHSALHAIWAAKQTQYRQLLRARLPAGAGLAMLGALLAATAVGWLRRRRWAWRTATIILGVNLVGDLVTAVVTRQWGDLVGALIEGCLLGWLLTHPLGGTPQWHG